jgi:hypothetical protein
LHVSHDFQESVRAVTVFSQLIEQGRNGAPGPESEYLGLVLGATQRVRELLDYVLIYAQAAPPIAAYGMVPLANAAQGALKDLHQEIADSKAHVELSPVLPMVWGYCSAAATSPAEPVSNAIKYRRPENAGEIRIDASRSPAGEWVVFGGGQWRRHRRPVPGFYFCAVQTLARTKHPRLWNGFDGVPEDRGGSGGRILGGIGSWRRVAIPVYHCARRLCRRR